MSDTLKPVDLALADFIAKLVEEILTAMVSSQQSQQERYTSMLQAASMANDDFAVNYISQQEIYDEIKLIIPGFDISAIQVLDITGYTGLLKYYSIDLTEGEEYINTHLTNTGIAKVNDGMRRYLATKKKDALLLSIQQGNPRVIIDNGRISARVNFTSFQSQTDTAGSTARIASGEIQGELVQNEIIATPLVRSNIRNVLTPLQLGPDIRLAITQVSTSSTGNSGFGDIELNFRTIYQK